MSQFRKKSVFASVLLCTAAAALFAAPSAGAQDGDITPGSIMKWRQGVGLTTEVCVKQENDVAGCQPAPFDVPAAMIPTRRVNASGRLDPPASEAEEDRKRGGKGKKG